MIKELILEVDEIIEKECNITFDGIGYNCETICKYRSWVGNKRLCALVDDLADKYKNDEM